MSAQPADQRQPPPTYASLRHAGEAATGNAAPPPATTVDITYLTDEARRLESLKQALFEAFLAAPASGIPTALVDLAATYTSALRLQLTLMGYTASPQRSYRSPAHQMTKARQP